MILAAALTALAAVALAGLRWAGVFPRRRSPRHAALGTRTRRALADARDGRTVAWLRSLHDEPGVSPLMHARIRVATVVTIASLAVDKERIRRARDTCERCHRYSGTCICLLHCGAPVCTGRNRPAAPVSQEAIDERDGYLERGLGLPDDDEPLTEREYRALARRIREAQTQPLAVLPETPAYLPAPVQRAPRVTAGRHAADRSAGQEGPRMLRVNGRDERDFPHLAPPQWDVTGSFAAYCEVPRG